MRKSVGLSTDSWGTPENTYSWAEKYGIHILKIEKHNL